MVQDDPSDSDDSDHWNDGNPTNDPGHSNDPAHSAGSGARCDRDGPADLDELLDAIHEHLTATQELPVQRTPARWIGEAEAVARDLAKSDLASTVVAERLSHVASLLAAVETTGDDAADERIERAKSLTTAALDVIDAD